MKTKAKKQVPLRFGSSLHKLVKTKLHENMTVSSGAMDALEDQAAYLIDRILHAAGEVQRIAHTRCLSFTAPLCVSQQKCVEDFSLPRLEEHTAHVLKTEIGDFRER